MTKKPQGVYVNEETHNQVSQYVDNALDGHGTLAGFIAFIEDALLAGMAAYERDAERFEVGEAALRAFNEAPKENLQQAENRARYETAWRQVEAALPWGESDPRAHMLALFMLSHDARLWQHDGAFGAPRASVASYEGLAGILKDMDRARQGREPQHIHQVRQWGTPRFATPLWKGATVEVALDEPKSRSTSFYLDDEAHQLAVSVFGRALFDRVERGLGRLFGASGNWLPWEAEFNFLEHGADLVGYQASRMDISVARFTAEQQEGWVEALAAGDAADPLVQTALFPYSWEHSTPDPYYLLAAHDPSVGIVTAHNTLVVAWRLGLIDPERGKRTDDLRRRLLPAFLERYGLQALAPERRLAYQVIRQAPARREPEVITNALDYHLLRLFQAYARESLPAEERTEERVALRTLATLAQPWLFPTRTTLEAYGNAKATKSPTGAWELASGRNTLVLSDADAYWTAKALNSVVTTQPTETLSPLLAPTWDDPDTVLYGPLIARRWVEGLSEFGARSRVKLRLGLEVVQRARELVARTGEPPAPLAAGTQLTAELTDEALQANGKFIGRFLEGLGREPLGED